MPKTQEKIRKYRRLWESEPWARGWLSEAPKYNFQEAFCTVCKTALRAHKNDLIKHTETTGHQKNMNILMPRKSAVIDNFVLTVTNDRKEAELLLTMHVAVHSSIRSIDHLSEVYNRKQSSDNQVKLHRTKCTALIKEVIAPTLLGELLEDIGQKPFSLIIDESTDVSVSKYLCVCVRYFSCEQNIVIRYLGIIKVERATAQLLYEGLKSFLTSLNLKIDNIIGLGTDGGSNLCGKNNSVFAYLHNENPNIQLVRCICHSLDNAASAACDTLPSNLEFLCREICTFFNHSASRRSDYKLLFDMLNPDQRFHNFVKISNTRWLSRYAAIHVLLEHYDNLKVHFNTVVNKERCYTANTINNMLNDDTNRLYFEILDPILLEINSLNLSFQKNNVEIGTAVDDIKNVILFLAKKVLKPVFLDSNIHTIFDNINNDLAYREPNDIDFGVGFYRSSRNTKLKTDEIYHIQKRAKNFIKSLLQEIHKRLPSNFQHFEKLQALSPKYCLSQLLRYKFIDLPFLNAFIKKENLSKVETQYNKLMIIDWSKLYGVDILDSSYKFWPVVSKHKNAAGQLIFQELTDYVILLLCLPMSNASVERVFSVMNATKTSNRNRMSMELLDALLQIKTTCFVKNQCCKNFQVTKGMLEKFNNSIYNTTPDSSNSDVTDQICDVVDEHFNIPCISIS